MNPDIRSPVPTIGHLPFGPEFQMQLLKLLCEDSGFANIIAEYIQPQHFENEALSWAIAFCLRHRHTYGGFPSMRVLRDALRNMDHGVATMYAAVIDQAAQMELRDEQYLRDQVIDFARRSIFVRSFSELKALFNANKVQQAYSLMMDRAEQITKATWEPASATWYFEDLPERQNNRMMADSYAEAVTTGLPWLDQILDGGIHKGELIVWVAYAKIGKTTLLNHHGVSASRVGKRVLHVMFEGILEQSTLRYDSAFMGEASLRVRHGDITAQKYAETWGLFQDFKRRLRIRAFNEEWDYSVVDIHQELKDLKRSDGWEPDLIIVDYGDLLRGREKHYHSNTDRQAAAFRDLKSLANRGNRVLTGSQARRPEKGSEDRPHWLYVREIADAYEKVRTADFLGSINVTNEEKSQNIMRLFAELYRSNEANKRCVVNCDYATGVIRQTPGLVSPSMPDLEQSPTLGYKQDQPDLRQTRFGAP